MRKQWTLNVRLFAVTAGISVPVLLLLLWINQSNLENLKNERLAESRAEVRAVTSQLDVIMELLEVSLINVSFNNPDFRLVAQANDRTIDFWRANQRTIQKIKSLGSASKFDYTLFAYFPKADLFLNASVNPPMTALLVEQMDNNARMPLENRWRTVFCKDQAYAVRVIRYEGYSIGAWIPYSSLLKKIGVTPAGEVGYHFADETGRLYDTAAPWRVDTGAQAVRDTDGNTWYVAAATSTKADFQFVKLIDSRYLSHSLPRVTTSILMVAGVLVLVFTVFIMGIYRWVIAPMNHMRRNMAVIEAGDMTCRISPPRGASIELERVIEQFNRMMDQLEHLKIEIYEGKLERQETKLQYLSQQIQPHFILNTLNTLYHYCDMDQKATKEIILLLTKFYRHVVNINSKYVTLGAELEHIDNYLKLQKMRFPHAFSYEIHCPSPYEIVPVPPFLIEGFVVNAMKYGLRASETGLISICVESLDEFQICIRIMDTGNGFSEDVLDSIREYVQLGKVSEELGVGLRNSIERLRLIYQDTSHIHFYNREPHGAVVEIIIALQKKEELERADQCADRG